MRHSALRLLVTASVAMGLGSGCRDSQEAVANGDDPIRALGATVLSTRYGPPYWAEQRRLGSATWTQAVASCTPERVRERPNCQTVADLAEAARGNAHADSVLGAIGRAATRPVR